MTNSGVKSRTVIIGIDGVPFRLMDTLSKEGVLPNFAELRKDGVFRKMASSIPEISSVSWSSIITGKNPGEHGIYGFTDIIPDTYDLAFPNFSDLKSPAFWQFGNTDDKKYVIINVPSTYPAQEINGFLVSGFVAIDLEKATYPKSYLPELTKMGYRIDVDSSKGHESKALLLDDLFLVHEIRTRAIRKLWDDIDWDVFMIVFTGSDRIGHFLWDAYEDPNHEHHQRFLDYFSEIDKTIGEIASSLEEGDNLIMCSDHGMELTEHNINVNKILKENGFLNLGNGPSLQYNNIIEGSRAFAMDPGRIYINRVGKYPRGSVQPGEDKQVIDEIIDLFMGLEINGKKIIKTAYRKEEIYKGSQIGNAPDIILLSNKGFNLKASLSELFEPKPNASKALTGKHSQDDAFLFVKGNDNNVIVPQKPKVEDIVGILNKLNR